MTITEAAPLPTLTAPADDIDVAMCAHLGCSSGEPTAPGPLFPGAGGQDVGGPRRPASWGGYGPGEADLDASCPEGLDDCCGRCGCQGE
jgi:hypothetical protein